MMPYPHAFSARTTRLYLVMCAPGIVLICSTCGNGSGKGRSEQSVSVDAAVLDHYREPVIAVTGKTRSLPNELNNPSAIAADGPRVWVLDINAGKESLLVLSASDGNILARSNSTVDDSISSAWSLDRPPVGDEGIWVYDFGSRKLFLIPYDSTKLTDLRFRRDIQLKSSWTLTGPIWRDAKTIVSAGFFPSGRLGFFDTTGRLLRVAGPTPKGGANIPAAVVQHAYQSTLAINSSRTRFALATRYADQIELFSADGTLIRSAERPFGFDPKYTVVSTGSGPIPDLSRARFGYVDVVADDQHIFALFSGKLSRRYHGRENYGNYIHIFDWEGNLLTVARLDQEALKISMLPHSDLLYAVGGPPDPQIRSYSVAALIRGSAK
jgi:hypothetical protein